MANPHITKICEETGASRRDVIRSIMPTFQPMTFPCEIRGIVFTSHNEYMNTIIEIVFAEL